MLSVRLESDWSERRSTGIWYRSERLKARTVVVKQSLTSVGATTMRGVSPCAP